MRNDPLIPNLAVVTDIRVDTPDVKTFRVVGLDGKKPFVHIPGQCAMLSVPGVSTRISVTTARLGISGSGLMLFPPQAF